MKLSKYIFYTILYIIVIPLFLNSCATAPTPEELEDARQRRRNLVNEKLNNPSRSLRITVNSNPSGAKVYGVENGQPGSFIGTTPMTFKYAKAGSSRWDSVWGTSPNETLVMKYVGALELTRKGSAYLAFQCILIKDGYHPYHLYQKIEYREGSTFTNPDLQSLYGGVKKTYTAILDPISTPDYQETIPKQQQQQQQQQQQTVIIPSNEESKKEATGVVMISANVDGADIYVDGMFVGNTPSNLKLKNGIHIIEVKLSGYKSFKRELRVYPDSEVSLRAILNK